MDKNLKYRNQDIIKGINLEENIPFLFQHLMNHYHSLATVRLSMHYESFYEAYCDDENTWGKDSLSFIEELNGIIGEAVLQNKYGSELEDVVKKVDKLRNTIMKKMNILTIFTDIFLTYEYVLNRIEYRFKEDMVQVNEEEFEKDVLRYIFDSEDNFMINQKIKEVIAQLPVRMTKQKFFDLLKDSMKHYLGADESSLNSYLYMIKSSALLMKEEEMQSSYQELWEKKEFLSSLNFKDISKDKYEEALKALRVATLILETESTIYLNLQEIINEVYTILLTSAYAGMVDFNMQNEVDAAFSIISGINGLFIKLNKEELPIELLNKFTDIEGVQETLSEEITLLEDTLYTVDKEYSNLCNSLMIDKQLNILLQSGKLLSNSLFINLNEQLKEEKIDEVRLTAETSSLVDELTIIFSNSDRSITKAIMANILNKMPVFFQTHKEVMDYVRYSIDQCSDKFEKAACINIIMNIIME